MNTSRSKERSLFLFAQAGGGLAAGIGFVALLGWILGLPRLASFGAQFIPMAPSTAFFFGLFGSVILLRARLTHNPAAHRAGLVIAFLGGMIAVLLFFLSTLGLRLEIEHLGFPLLTTQTFGDFPVGHMSPVTAFSFVLVSVTFLIQHTTSQPKGTVSAFWLTSLILASNYFLVIAYFVGKPLLYSDSIIPPALPTSLAFVALGIALLAFIRTSAGFLRLILAMLVPLAAFFLQAMFWAAIKPFAWFLFFPAVFFSSWIGGLSGGVMATVLSTALAWWFFIPPEGSFRLEDPFTLGSIGLFIVMGVLFGFTQERIKTANRATSDALGSARSANDQLQSANQHITGVYETESRKSEALLREAFTLLQAVTDSIPDGIFVKDRQGRYLLINPAGAEWLGQPVEQVLGKHDTVFLSAEAAAVIMKQNIQVMEQGKQITLEQEQEVAETTRTFLVTKAPYRDQQGEIVGVLGIRRDITERKDAENHIRKLNRIYAMLSDVNQAIVRHHDLQELYETVCRIAVEKGGFRMAWIGLLDKTTHRMQVAAYAGFSGSYFDHMAVASYGPPKPYCPVDGALRCGEHVLCNLADQRDTLAPCQKVALELGYRASASFPLRIGDAVCGAFTLYSDTSAFFDAEELKLLDELAQDISYAMGYSVE